MERFLSSLFVPEDLSFWQKFKNLLYIFALNTIWCCVALLFLTWLFPKADAASILGVPPMSQVMYNPVVVFFWAVIMAPCWEEAIFRYFPAKLAQSIDSGDRNRFKIAIIIFSSIIFGLVHGSVLNILIQGVGGLFLFWIYCKNGLVWSILSHALWNGMIIFGLSQMYG